MSDKDKEEVDIIEYTKGTRMDDAYYLSLSDMKYFSVSLLHL